MQDQVIRGVGRGGRVLLSAGWAENEEKAEVRWREQASITRIHELQHAINRDEWGQRSAGQHTAMKSARGTVLAASVCSNIAKIVDSIIRQPCSKYDN